MMPEPTDAPLTPNAAHLLEVWPTPVPTGPLFDPNPTPRARLLEPRARKPRSARQRSYALARIYCERHPLIRLEAVAAVTLKAIEDGRWTDDEIKKAVDELARANGRVTVDTLRSQLVDAHGLRGGVSIPYDRRPSVSEDSVVYVIASKAARPVKIGTSTNVTQRLAGIQLMCPVILEVLHAHPGEYDLEAWLHAKFRRFRLHGEWFDFGKRDAVAEVREAIHAYEELRRAREMEHDPGARRRRQAQIREALAARIEESDEA